MRKGQKQSEETRRKMSLASKGKPKPWLKGRKLSDARRKQLSDIHKAIGDKPPSRAGTIPWNKGKTGIYSEETIKKIKTGRARQVIKHSMESRRKIGLAHSGENCTFWKGGISKVTCALRKHIQATIEYRQWRSDVFQRDDYTCQRCGLKGGVLNADHIKTFATIIKEYKITTKEQALLCAELWNINNGRTLCKPCHKSRKKWENI